MRYFTAVFAMIFGYVINTVAQVKTTDSIFIKNSRPINFVVDKINISESDKQWITDVLIPELQRLGDKGIIIGRATASPDGPLLNNYRLANGRRASVNALLKQYGIDTDIIRYDIVAEDYPLLHALMKFNNDRMFPLVDSLMTRYDGDYQKLKVALVGADKGRVWKHIVGTYSPKLRAVRIMAINRDLVDVAPMPPVVPIEPVPFCFAEAPVAPAHLNIQMPFVPVAEPERIARRELWSIKTNLLLDFAYMPGYERFCPIPNVAVEYYPLHGHFTYGASFDGPWWQHYNMHKYFQLRNYQLFTRYYLRSGDIERNRPGEGAAFKGLYFNMYAHAFLYNICFGEKRGWEGEGWGTGLGIGYTLPLGKSEHWRLDFGIQAGFFNTRYDPYQWRCPVNPETDPVKYYYKWYGDAKDFKKRQHSYSWFGPTRIDITLSYDILYRKRAKK